MSFSNIINRLPLLLFIVFQLVSCWSAKVESISKDSEVREVKSVRYFDQKSVEISKSKFDEMRSSKKYLAVPGDSINHKKLIFREERGTINDRKALELLLERSFHREIDSTKALVIIYFTGKDRCNVSGTAGKGRIRYWYRQLENGLDKIAQIRPIYIYKDINGLEKYEGIINWHKDPEAVIEKLFFEHHYPCHSFVVISKDGDYISYFGEFGMDYVWEATQILSK